MIIQTILHYAYDAASVSRVFSLEVKLGLQLSVLLQNLKCCKTVLRSFWLVFILFLCVQKMTWFLYIIYAHNKGFTVFCCYILSM